MLPGAFQVQDQERVALLLGPAQAQVALQLDGQDVLVRQEWSGG